MLTCPVCGRSDQNEWNQCPPRDGELVCVECCSKCKHHQNIYRCAYNATLEDKIKDLAKEIAKKEEYIETLTDENQIRIETARLYVMRGKKRAMEERGYD